jgi:hypothetical protein
MYKYVERLKPKVESQPLTRGKWMHALLEAHYSGADWEAEHKKWSSQFRKLFDEEKEQLGDLPTECRRLMEAYLWHYGDPAHSAYDWKVHEVELTLEAEMPNGHLFRGRIDLLVEDDFGLWIVDHKNHKRLPDWDTRMLDEQSPMYIWAAHQNDIPVRGFIWNYLKTTGLDNPAVLKDGSRFYKRVGDCDYPTYARAVKKALEDFPGVFLADRGDKTAVRVELARLKAQRWSPGAMQTSPFFRRDLIEKSDDMIARVMAAAVRTSDRMHSYDFSDPDCVERNVGACKGFMCSYPQLSMMDLVKGDSEMIKSRLYRKGGDPLDYYDGRTE